MHRKVKDTLKVIELALVRVMLAAATNKYWNLHNLIQWILLVFLRSTMPLLQAFLIGGVSSMKWFSDPGFFTCHFTFLGSSNLLHPVSRSEKREWNKHLCTKAPWLGNDIYNFSSCPMARASDMNGPRHESMMSRNDVFHATLFYGRRQCYKPVRSLSRTQNRVFWGTRVPATTMHCLGIQSWLSLPPQSVWIRAWPTTGQYWTEVRHQ